MRRLALLITVALAVALATLALLFVRPPETSAVSIVVNPSRLSVSFYPTIRSEDCIAVVGIRGSGKSTFGKIVVDAHQLVRTYVTRAPQRPRYRVLFYDLKDEWSVFGRRRSNVILGPLRQRITFEDFFDRGGYRGLIRRPDLSLAVVASDPADPVRCATEMTELSRLALNRQVGKLLFGATEVATYSLYCQQAITVLTTQSRSDEVPVLLDAQFMVAFPKPSRRMLSQVYSGVQSDPDDLDALRKLAGRFPGYADRVACLPRLHFEPWHVEGPAALGKAV